MAEVIEAPVWREVLAHADVRVCSDSGAHIVRLKAGETRRVHPELFIPAIALGCSVPGGETGQTLSNEEVIAELEVAIRSILADGRDTQVTKAGVPRLGPLKMLVARFTEDQRATALENVLAADAGTEPDEVAKVEVIEPEEVAKVEVVEPKEE